MKLLEDLPVDLSLKFNPQGGMLFSNSTMSLNPVKVKKTSYTQLTGVTRIDP
jgi:hypothetical protein